MPLPLSIATSIALLAGATDDAPIPAVLDAHVRASAVAQGQEPSTALRFDTEAGPLVLNDAGQLEPVGLWRIDELLRPEEPQRYGGIALSLAAEWEPHRWVLASLWLDTGEIRSGRTLEPPVEGATINGSDVGTELGRGRFIRELSLTLGPPGVTVEVGRRHTRIADGVLYDDFGTGAHLITDLEALGWRPIRIELSLFAIDRELETLFDSPSPLVLAAVSWDWSLFESVSIFGAGFRDRSGQLRDVLASSAAEGVILRPPDLSPLGPEADRQFALNGLLGTGDGDATMGYVGAHGNLLLGSVSVRATAVAQTGRATVVINEARTFELDLGGWAAALELHRGLGDNIDLGLLGFSLSGDAAPFRDSDYDAFIGIAPLWTWTGLFFSGGITQGLYAGRAVAAGVNGHGVFGGGPTVSWVTDTLLIDTRAIWLHAPIQSPPLIGGGGHAYGLEADIVIEWRPAPWLAVAGELDLLWPGNFFPSSDLAHRAILLWDVSHAM